MVFLSLCRVEFLTYILFLLSKEFNMFCRSCLLVTSSHNFFKDFIYSSETQRLRQRHRQREKQASHREPVAGLDPIPGSHSEPKADTQPLSHPGVPGILFSYAWRLGCVSKRREESQKEGTNHREVAHNSTVGGVDPHALASWGCCKKLQQT